MTAFTLNGKTVTSKSEASTPLLWVIRDELKAGVVEQSNFHDYHLLRMADVPETIEVAFVDRDASPSGLGEIGNPWVAAAVANAFYKLTGKRLHHMPFTPARVQQVLKT